MMRFTKSKNIWKESRFYIGVKMLPKEMQIEIDFLSNLYKHRFITFEELDKLITYFSFRRAEKDLKEVLK